MSLHKLTSVALVTVALISGALISSGCTSNSESQTDEAAKETTKSAASAAVVKPSEVAKNDLLADEIGSKAEAKNERHKSRKPASVARNNVYVVQIGAFRIKENANKLQEKLKSDGFSAFVEPLQHSKNGLLYLVRMNPVHVRSEAELMRASLKTKAQIDSMILALSSVDGFANPTQTAATKKTAPNDAPKTTSAAEHAPASTNE